MADTLVSIAAAAKAEYDSLVAQVVKLREALDRLTHPSLSPGARATYRDEAIDLLADTEAAATAWLEAHDRAVVKERTDELARTIDVLFEYLENDSNYKVTHCAHCEQAYRGRHPTCMVEWTGARDREQQLAGARDALQELRHLLAEHVGPDFRHSRIKDSYDADVRRVLEALEREASGL